MKMYTHVQESLDGVYKELTRSDRFPLGGSASIVLANRDDPFAQGWFIFCFVSEDFFVKYVYTYRAASSYQWIRKGCLIVFDC